MSQASQVSQASTASTASTATQQSAVPQAQPASASPTIVLLMGAPGSGKGTQGRFLARHFNMPYLASGDLLRLAIEEQSEQGRRVQAYVERGLYVPDELMVPMVMAELERHYRGRSRGVILDGFPRTREQAVALDEALGAAGAAIRRVLFLYVPKDVLVSRLASRYTCRNCGATYNLLTKPPTRSGICDVCGHHPLYQRVDDQPDKVERRLSVDLEKAVPLAAYYHQHGILCEVDGNRPAPEVTAALIAAVEGCRHGPPK
ncbi:MAG TPA: nucleoside monophosphate kinase [Chloroflexota bacterium]|nr:nucleoside monophosphate kinase [Chloroflexota bacterium]